jgi:hypothetical protein
MIDFEQDLEHLLGHINTIQYERVTYKKALEGVLAGMKPTEDGKVMMDMTPEAVEALAKAVELIKP